MFWANIYASSPHIEALLKKEDVTLHELMDQDEIVPECKSQNKKLIDYLSRPDIMQELVTLTTKEPSTDVDERSRYKYPNVACELLTCNVPSLNEKLAGDETLLAKLYSFIDTDEPLNPLLASFFSKTIGVLLTRRSDQVLEFLKTREKCVDRLLQHLETSAIMDLVLKLVTKVEGGDMRQNVLNWLDSQQLVQRLIKLLSPTSEPSRHANAALLLCDMFKFARFFRLTCTERTDPDPLLNTSESEETVSLLLETILTGEPVESSIVGGIEVLLVLLGHENINIANEGDMQGNSAGEDTNDDESRIKIQNATLPYLELLQKLLLNPPPKPPVKTTAGLLTSPLGNTRLHIAKLLAALLYTSKIEIFRKLAQLGTFQILLDLFFKYSWNNFLHTQVEQCLGSVINGKWQENSEEIYSHIFVECQLINRLLEAWNKNDNKQNTEKTVRQGYMGHLINIVNNIVKECTNNEVLDAYLKANPSPEVAKKWEELVTTELVEINETHQLLLGGKPQPYMTGSDDPNDEYNSYGQEAYIQQVYSNYQGQQMTPNFIEHCGFHDDEFNDRDDALHNSMDQLTTMPFTLNEEDLDKGEDMFDRICQQKQRAGLDESGGAVEWGDEGELTFQTVIDKRDWPSKQQHHDSNSSDEDEDPRELNMEVDPTDPWGAAESLSSNAILPRVNPWEVDPADSADPTGWANFDNFDSALTISDAPKFESAVAPTGQEFAPGAPLTGLPFARTFNPAYAATTQVESSAVADNGDNVENANNESATEVVTVEQQSRKADVMEAADIVKAKSLQAPTECTKVITVEEESPPKIETTDEISPSIAEVTEKSVTSKIEVAEKNVTSKIEVTEENVTSKIEVAEKNVTSKIEISEKNVTPKIEDTEKNVTSKTAVAENIITSKTEDDLPIKVEVTEDKSPLKTHLPSPETELTPVIAQQPGNIFVDSTIGDDSKKSDETSISDPEKQEKPQTTL